MNRASKDRKKPRPNNSVAIDQTKLELPSVRETVGLGATPALTKNLYLLIENRNTLENFGFKNDSSGEKAQGYLHTWHSM